MPRRTAAALRVFDLAPYVGQVPATGLACPPRTRQPEKSGN